MRVYEENVGNVVDGLHGITWNGQSPFFRQILITAGVKKSTNVL